MIPIHGIMVPGMCPPMRPKELKCPRVDETSASLNRNDGVSDNTQVSNAPETAADGVELTLLPNSNSIEVFTKGKSVISLEIDPILKKNIRLEWTYKLSEVDTGSEVDAGYEDPLGFIDGPADTGFDVASV